MRFGMHGTTKEKAEAIMKEGFSPSSSNWIVSDGNYFWDAIKLAEETGQEEDDSSYQNYGAIQRAWESGCFATLDNESKYVYVIVVDLDSVAWVNDESCDNMEGAVETQESPTIVAVIEIVKDVTYFKPYYLAGVRDNDMLNVDPDPALKLMADLIADNEIYMEEAYEMDDFRIVYRHEDVTANVLGL